MINPEFVVGQRVHVYRPWGVESGTVVEIVHDHWDAVLGA